MLLISAMAISMMACGEKEEVVDEIPVEITDATTEEEEVAEDTFFDDENSEGKVRSYISGEWVDPEIQQRRPIATMIENTEACLPQYGVSNAGIVYECPVEGSITRMMAIFDDYSGMDRIGNTRSSRPYFVYFASEYEAIYSHAGGNPAAFELIDNGLVENLNGLDGDIGSSYFRSSDKNAPHNLYTSSDGLEKAIEKKGYNTSYSSSFQPHFQFTGDNKLSDGDDCEGVKLYFFYNEPYFKYDSETGLYLRYEFDKAQMDGAVNEQLTAKNIIIQSCSWFDYTGSQYIGFDLPNNSGTGKFITNGKIVDIKWSKAGDTDITHYYYASNGEEIKLNPGTTWIELCQDTYYDQNTYYESASDLK